MVTTEISGIPAGYENDLSSYYACVFDAYCGEPVGWGHRILRQLGAERFEALRQYGELQCIYPHPHWFLVTRKLTRAEAIELYGPVTNEEFGPRGGWKSVTFGTRTFLSRFLQG